MRRKGDDEVQENGRLASWAKRCSVAVVNAGGHVPAPPEMPYVTLSKSLTTFQLLMCKSCLLPQHPGAEREGCSVVRALTRA